MAREKMAEKLGAYFARLGEGRAHKIKPADVEKVIEKLRERRDALFEDVTAHPDKAERLAVKISTVDDLLDRAEWLLAQITRDPRAALSPEPPAQD